MTERCFECGVELPRTRSGKNTKRIGTEKKDGYATGAHD